MMTYSFGEDYSPPLEKETRTGCSRIAPVSLQTLLHVLGKQSAFIPNGKETSSSWWQQALSEQPWTRRSPSHLLHGVLAGRADPLDVAVLNILPALTREQHQMVSLWHQGQPILTHIITTPLGRLGLFVLPVTAPLDISRGEEQSVPPVPADGNQEAQPSEPTSQQDVLRQACAAVSLAQACGARVVTLSDDLALLTNNGRLLHEALISRAGNRPRLTTAGATRSAALILNLQHLLPLLRRHFHQERVAVLAGDDRARATIHLLLTIFPHPQSLIWCDLLAPQRQQGQPPSHVSPEQVRQVLADQGFQGTAVFDEVRDGSLPSPIYDATLIIEATTGMPPATMDALQLVPGTIVLTSSQITWASPEQAEQRFATREDVLLVDGMELASHAPLHEQRFAPDPAWEGAPVLERLIQTDSIRGLRPETPYDLSAERWAGLLVQALEAPAICGALDNSAAFAHYQALREAQLSGTPLHRGNHRWSPAFLTQFRARFRTRPA